MPEDLLFPPLPYAMRPRADQAVADVQLQQFVNAATYAKDQGRKQAFAAAFGARQDAVRDLAARIRQHTLDHLDHYLALFADRAAAAGATVHFAPDAQQANALCGAIARRHNCKLCVKAKSMVTEEIRLVPALEAVGCTTIETDLGEFIIQLDHDAPSHIVTPMIHKNRAAVARAFQRELGVPYTEDPAELTRIAREHLRGKYRQADLGITGANFLAADTGSVVVCTNEGNGRFCANVPRVHVVVTGIEKIIPGLEHLGVLLKVLARGSTAQPLTVYTQVITGPRRSAEHAGPEELHIILVDNGRSQALGSDLREMLRCIRCGACLNACPVYRKVGGHAYGSVYSGPIGAILTPMWRGLENYPDLPNASSLCGACLEACPVKIDIPRLLIQQRAQMVQRGIPRLRDRLLFRFWAIFLRHPLLYRLGGWLQRRLLRRHAAAHGTLHAHQPGDPYTQRGWINDLRGSFAGWTDTRAMPTPPAKSFRDWWDKEGK